MGFEKGRGLGKNLQGRALPIQVHKRQGKGAVDLLFKKNLFCP